MLFKKILIVDDDEEMLDTWKLLLESEGYEVDTEAYLDVAYEKVATPDKGRVIVLDVMFPKDYAGKFYSRRDDGKSSGIKFCETLQKDNIAVDLVMITGKYSDPSLGKTCLKKGLCNKFLNKPFKFSELVAKIREIEREYN